MKQIIIMNIYVLYFMSDDYRNNNLQIECNYVECKSIQSE